MPVKKVWTNLQTIVNIPNQWFPDVAPKFTNLPTTKTYPDKTPSTTIMAVSVADDNTGDLTTLSVTLATHTDKFSVSSSELVVWYVANSIFPFGFCNLHICFWHFFGSLNDAKNKPTGILPRSEFIIFYQTRLPLKLDGLGPLVHMTSRLW